MKIKYTLLFVLLFATSLLSQAQQESDDLKARIKRIENGLMPSLQIKGKPIQTFNINERLKQLGIPGISVAFVNNGKMEWSRAYGMADVATNRPMTTETLLLAGSISKPIAALRAHQMVESGKLKLDENVNNYLKSWKLPDNEFTENEKVTLRRILNHTAGLTVWGFPGYLNEDELPSTIDILDGKGNTDPVRVYKKPGESWMYSGGGYTIMQLMVADVEGIPFAKTLQQHVLNPLGMTESTFENPLPKKYHNIAATGYNGRGQEVKGKWPVYREMAAAGLWTTPSQLIQYAIEVQKIDNTKKDGILKYSTVKEMLTPGMNDHGLGPQTSKSRFGHGGADNGFRANMIAWRDQPYALVVMVNSDNGQIMQELQLAVAKEYNLSGIQADVRETIEISEAELQKYVGRYQVGDIGVVEAKIADGLLTFEAPFVNPTMHMFAESQTIFFDRQTGNRVSFEIKDNKVTGFTVQGIKARKLNK